MGEGGSLSKATRDLRNKFIDLNKIHGSASDGFLMLFYFPALVLVGPV